MDKINGVCPPVITLFDQNGNLDIAANKRQADFLIKEGVNGLAYLGTSGEFSILTLEEKMILLKEMVPYVKHRVKVIAGVGDTSYANTIALLHKAQEIGVDAVLLINPYFSVYTEEMVFAYYDQVAKETALPIIIYNFPELTGFCFSTQLVMQLVAKHRNFIGIKETIGDPEHIRDMMKVKEINPDFTVFCAYENQAIGTLANGVDGFINATANFAPEFTVKTYQAYQQGNYQEAFTWYKKMCEAMDIYQYSTPLFLACKQAAYERIHAGWQGGERLPGLPLSEEKKEKVRVKLETLGLL